MSSFHRSPRRFSALGRDVRAIGPTAPIRAAYELSKRVGGHRVVFGSLEGAPAPGAPRSVIPAPVAVPADAQGRALADADRVVAGSTPIFGQLLPVDLSFHAAPDTGGAWARRPWWQVDIRSADRIADVKWTWELGRHRHLVVLARAVWLAPEDDRYSLTLERELRRWLAENPPEHGVHWYSNLEIALRALAWLQLLALAGDRLPQDVVSGMHDHLFHSGRHLVADTPYTVSSMRNNHMLGDALGLIALGIAFDKPLWRTIGNRMFTRQLTRHMRADGSMIEDSLSYHRFVTEMLAVRVLLGDSTSQVRVALRDAGRYLARLGALDGPLPQYGDWDEGRVLTTSSSPHDIAGVAALAAAMTGSGASDADRATYDECAWYASPGDPDTTATAVHDGSAVGGGFARATRGEWRAWLKAGGGTSHQHADLGSTVLRVGDQWVIGDPGTGTYNGPIAQRNAFRTSGAHSVLRLAGTDQLGPHRAFRWLHAAHGRPGGPVVIPGATVMWGVHDAYTRIDGGGRIVRVVVLGDRWMSVADVTDARPGTAWDLTLPLHPSTQAHPDGRLRLGGGTELQLDLPGPVELICGRDEPFEGWWSDTYGDIQPTTWVRTAGTLGGAVVWSVRSAGVVAASALTAGLRVGSTQLTVDFAPSHVDLLVDGEDGPKTFSIRTSL